ncbi:MAG: carboxypeptidase regulatory-like domain-containing protein, partial [Bacteroidia bacterium]|nr:carboxypeptidase regulatory-like domain-containing protein [Bacteroidia bacterium]
MKQLLSIVLLIVFLIPAASAQQKKRDKVKRKYRKVEQVVAETQPPVFLRGKIRDHDDNLLPGATVVVVETKKRVNVNEKGEFFFYGLPT